MVVLIILMSKGEGRMREALSSATATGCEA